MFWFFFCVLTTHFSGAGIAETPAVPGGPGALPVPSVSRRHFCWTRASSCCSRWPRSFRSPGRFRACFFFNGRFHTRFRFFCWLFCSGCSGRFLPCSPPSGFPPPLCFPFGLFWPFLFLSFSPCLQFASCIFLFRLGQQHCQKPGCNGPSRPSICAVALDLSPLGSRRGDGADGRPAG